jgi:hypothetical protein
MADVGCIDVIDRVLFLINLLVLAFLLRLRVPLAKTAKVENADRLVRLIPPHALDAGHFGCGRHRVSMRRFSNSKHETFFLGKQEFFHTRCYSVYVL